MLRKKPWRHNQRQEPFVILQMTNERQTFIIYIAIYKSPAHNMYNYNIGNNVK